MDENNHIINNEDLEKIYNIINADKNIVKLNEKMEKVLDKVKPLVDDYNSKMEATAVKFATEKDDEFFNKVILNGGYVKTNLSEHIPGGNDITKKSPLEYINRYNINKAMGYNDFSFGTETTATAYLVCYWTDVERWVNFLSKLHLYKKIDEKLDPFIKLGDKLIEKSMDMAKKYFKQNQYKNYNAFYLLEDFKSFIIEKEQEKYFSGSFSDIHVLFKVGAIQHGDLNKVNKDNTFRSKKINKMLLSEFVTINKKGYQAILNSDGDVVPFIDGKEIKNSIINGKYKEYKKKLIDNAEHFDEYKEIYFKKHITTDDTNEDSEDLNDEKSDEADLK